MCPVTAQMLDSTSFSSRGGLTRAQPGPGGDVARRIEIGIHLAVRSADHGVLPGASAFPSAMLASDACAGGVYEHHAPASFFRFAGEDTHELCPIRVEDCFVQS